MQQRAFGAAGRKVSVIGQGTWDMEKDERSSAIASLRLGLDLGLTHIDTAEMYGSGLVEEIVGEALAGRRDDAFLVSKVLPQNASRAGTLKACEASLKRLRTDHLDVYLLHWRGRYPLQETLASFQALKDQGKILHWGVSNFDVSDLEEMNALPGGSGMACNQVLYHLEERAIESAVLPWCQAHRVAVTAYSPFGHGNFPKAASPKGRLLQKIAAGHNATPRQVALQFLVRHQNVFAIPKASNAEHAKENAAASSLEFDPHEVEALDALFPKPKKQKSLPTL
jgi:diketogulonate reductase-like aldo/keto reductase